MFSLEMIGYFSDEPDSQSYPLPVLGLIYPKTGDFIAAVGRLREMKAVRDIKRFFQAKTDLPIYSLTAPPLIPGNDAVGSSQLLVARIQGCDDHRYGLLA